MRISVGEELIYLTGESIINEGYLKMEPERINNKLPNLTKYQEFDVKFIVSEKKTTIPKKVTESELANFLKNPFKNTKLDEEIEAMNEENDTDDYKSILNGIEIYNVHTCQDTKLNFLVMNSFREFYAAA